MGWAFDDEPYLYAPGELEARERAEVRFRGAGERAMARAQQRSHARGDPEQTFISDGALYTASGLPNGGLPIPELRAWTEKLEEAKPVTQSEVDDFACTICTLLGALALNALRAIELGENDGTSRCDLSLLRVAEDMIPRRIKSPGARTLFEFAAALIEEAAWLGARFQTWNGVSFEDTTARFVALAPTIGV